MPRERQNQPLAQPQRSKRLQEKQQLKEAGGQHSAAGTIRLGKFFLDEMRAEAAREQEQEPDNIIDRKILELSYIYPPEQIPFRWLNDQGRWRSNRG